MQSSKMQAFSLDRRKTHPKPRELLGSTPSNQANGESNITQTHQPHLRHQVRNSGAPSFRGGPNTVHLARALEREAGSAIVCDAGREKV